MMNGITNAVGKMGRGFSNGHMYYDSKEAIGMGGFPLAAMIIRVVITIAIIVVIVMLIKKGKKNRVIKNKFFEEKHNFDRTGYTAALSILNTRYVNGEISDQEYIRKKAILNGEVIESQEENLVNIEKNSTNNETNDSE